MFGFEKMFDFKRAGKLNSWERVVQFQFMDEILKDNTDSSNYDDTDVFGDVGLDYDELEMMDPEERRETLEDVGLDPDEYDF